MSAVVAVELGERAYDVHVGPGVAARVAEALGSERAGCCAVVTDDRVGPLHLDRLRGLEAAPRHVVAAGEGAKTFAVLEELLEALASAGLDRRSTLVAFGGGTVGDLTGLAASLYMRGIEVVQCPTTLLAQVDASVGGKTAVNLAAGKNLAGTFHQPRAVFADTELLATLERHELASGLGEVVKTALIGGQALLGTVERAAEALVARDAGALAEVVEGCVRVKASVVASDERERGGREVLNLGHTFAHAVERVAGYGAIPHGVAVACGLVLALETARASGLLEDGDLVARTAALLRQLGLPVDLDELRSTYATALEPRELVEAMRTDKKGRAGVARLVLPRAAGAIAHGVEVPEAHLLAVLSDATG